MDATPKRVFDIGVSAMLLLLFFPLVFLVAILIKSESSGSVFFRQKRFGRNFVPFELLKFRTMTVSDASPEIPLATLHKNRITRVGRFLRLTKIDELPQLLNVLRGEMSLVGPRPEVSRFVEYYRRDFEEILKVSPGITDFASLKYRHESDLLDKAPDAEEEYLSKVLPEKIRLGKEYIAKCSFWLDLKVIGLTIVEMFR